MGCDNPPDGLGFVKDGLYDLNDGWDKLRVVVVSEMPSKNEVNIGDPLAGPDGYANWIRYYQAAGFQREEVGFTWLTRCYKWNHAARKPGLIGTSAKDAYKKCRTHDRIIPAFRPDVAVLSQNPVDAIVTQAFYRLILADLRKARLLADHGMRPLVLLGDAPIRHYFPNLQGTKKWFGSYFTL